MMYHKIENYFYETENYRPKVSIIMVKSKDSEKSLEKIMELNRPCGVFKSHYCEILNGKIIFGLLKGCRISYISRTYNNITSRIIYKEKIPYTKEKKIEDYFTEKELRYIKSNLIINKFSL